MEWPCCGSINSFYYKSLKCCFYVCKGISARLLLKTVFFQTRFGMTPAPGTHDGFVVVSRVAFFFLLIWVELKSETLYNSSYRSRHYLHIQLKWVIETVSQYRAPPPVVCMCCQQYFNYFTGTCGCHCYQSFIGHQARVGWLFGQAFNIATPLICLTIHQYLQESQMYCCTVWVDRFSNLLQLK